MVDSVVGDVGLCHEVNPAVGTAALEEVAPSDAGLIIICLLEG
jgi:hypothetical protein